MLFKKEYDAEPVASPRGDTKAPEAPSNTTKAKDDKNTEDAADNISDDYEDDFDEVDEPAKAKQDEKKAVNADDDDDWDMDDDDLADLDNGNKEPSKAADKKEADSSVNPKEIAEKKRRDLFFGGGTDDLNDLEELEMIGGKDFDNNNEDKFNQVLSTSKENGGLLASIGLKKGGDDESLGDESQEEDPHKKSDLFDTSKDRGKASAGASGAAAKKDKNLSEDEEFDLGFESSKKGVAGD